MKFTLLLLMTILSFSSTASTNLNAMQFLKHNDQLSILTDLIGDADLERSLKRGRVTVFAPTNEAFNKLGSEVMTALQSDTELLRSVLSYHVSKGAKSFKSIKSNYQIKTLAGKIINIYKEKRGIILNNEVKLTSKAVRVSNGYVYVIDSILTFDESTANNDIETEQNIDLTKYLGVWYEIGRYDNSFQKGCVATRATYSKKGKKIGVLNECLQENGKIKKARALAFVANKDTQAELKVSFVPFFNRFGLFAGDYNILKIGDDYDYALVGDKKRKTFWILSRSTTMSDGLYSSLVRVAVEKGYRADLIIRRAEWSL